MLLFNIKLPQSWHLKTAEQLAGMLATQGRMKKTRLTIAFQTAMKKGGSEAEQAQIFGELAKVYGLPNSEFINNLRDAMHDGDAVQINILAQIGAGILSWSELTVEALTAVIADLTIAPTAAEVAAELEMMEFSWDGGAWIAVDTP